MKIDKQDALLSVQINRMPLYVIHRNSVLNLKISLIIVRIQFKYLNYTFVDYILCYSTPLTIWKIESYFAFDMFNCVNNRLITNYM